MIRHEVDCFGISDVGRVRETNQDQFLIADLRKSMVVHHSSLGYDERAEISGASRAKLLMVADGMGGHACGERASWLAVDGMVQYLLTNVHWPIRCEQDHESSFFRGLSDALEYAQGQMRADSVDRPEQREMGTTLTMVWVVWPHAYMIHVGDSRAYRLHGGQLRQLSHDQTLAQALIDQGVFQPDAPEARQFSNVLTSALGCASTMEPLYSRCELQFGDKLLICSDGLNKHMDDEAIEEILNANDCAEIACRRLIDETNEAGGTDNTTIILAAFREAPADREWASDIDLDASTAPTQTLE